MMIEAIELVCRGRAIVLVVEDMSDMTVISDEERPVTGRQLLDMNRARAYLREAAERNDV